MLAIIIQNPSRAPRAPRRETVTVNVGENVGVTFSAPTLIKAERRACAAEVALASAMAPDDRTEAAAESIQLSTVSSERNKTMSNQSYGYRMQGSAADQAMRENYFDPDTAGLGGHVPYRDESDNTDDRAWNDAEATLAKRKLKLVDDGDGYVIRPLR